ncbi:hypothetical protein O9992_01925 [Vibrio lentus]|nr:hypothetical protein [Vibrio lentus]
MGRTKELAPLIRELAQTVVISESGITHQQVHGQNCFQRLQAKTLIRLALSWRKGLELAVRKVTARVAGCGLTPLMMPRKRIKLVRYSVGFDFR